MANPTASGLEYIRRHAEQGTLDAVAQAWHQLAPQLVAVANQQRNVGGDPLFVWAEAAALLKEALALPEAGHKCSGVGCKFGYAHAAGF